MHNKLITLSYMEYEINVLLMGDIYIHVQYKLTNNTFKLI